MLGRLFQQSSSSNVASPSPPLAPSITANDTYDDCHTRTFLYGNSKVFKPVNFNSKQFRLIISQDGGNLRSKQVLYDSNKLGDNQNCKKSYFDSKHSKVDSDGGGCDYKQVQRLNTYAINKESETPTNNNDNDKFNDNNDNDNYDKIDKNDKNDKNFNNNDKYCNDYTSKNGNYIHSNNTPDRNISNPVNNNGINSTIPNNSIPLASKYIKSDPNYVAKKGVSLINSYNIADIDDYMFGCGLPSNESCSVTKIHILPQLNNKTWSILITRLFSISTEDIYLVKSLDWQVSSTLPINQNHIIQPANKSRESINSRFSIGIIIPLQNLNDIQDLVFLNWIELSHYLLNLQKFIFKKLIFHLNLDSNKNNSYIINKRIQFSNYILQQDLDINQYLLKFIKLFHYINLPKLINSNDLINEVLISKSQFNSPKNYQFKSLLFSWLMEILNWLNFKDGNDGFLPSLFALILPIKNSLAIKPYEYSKKIHREVTRIVIMTSNPTIVKKLIFIINGLIPSNNFIVETKQEQELETQNENDYLSEKFTSTRPETIYRNSSFTNPDFNGNNSPDVLKKIHNHRNTNLTSPSALTKIHRYCERLKQKQQEEDFDHSEDGTYLSMHKNKCNTPNETSTQPNSPIKPINIGIPKRGNNLISSYVGTPILEDSVVSSNNFAYPIPIKAQNTYGSPISFENDISPNHSSPSIKGWEIPGKSTVSTTTSTNFSIIEPMSQNIPISNTRGKDCNTHPTLSKLASMAYLSTSLNSSLSSSTSKYSFNNIGGSFFEKWKNPLGISQSTQNTPGYTFDEYFPPPPNKKNSFQSFKSFSPAVEHDDFNWHSGLTSLSSSYGKSQPITPTKISRSQLILEINNIHDDIELLINENKTGMNMNLSRTNSGIFSPIMNDTKDCYEYNQALIMKRCQAIMKKRNILIKKWDDNVLEVDCLPREDGAEKEKEDGIEDDDDDDEIYELSDPDQSTITSISSLSLNKQVSKSSIIKLKNLNPIVSFTEEFRPEFNLQSCPASNKLEQQIMSTMKQDLLYYQNFFHYEKITTRTILVSLRAREIKQIEMRINNKGIVDSSNQEFTRDSQFSLPNIPKPVNNTYHTKIKKVYTPTRNIGNLKLIQSIEAIFGEIDQLINYNKDKSQDFYDNLIKLVRKLLVET